MGIYSKSGHFVNLSKSDFIDILGIRLFSNPTVTRRENGEEMVQFVKNITDRWKSGKFMPLLDRTQSVNVYILSKLWYRCGAVDLRKGDIDKMISHIKSWIYADMFLKPEEIKLFRGKKDGGLGMDCIETKSKSNLITSFLEMACNKKYLNNEYMTASTPFLLCRTFCYNKTSKK